MLKDMNKKIPIWKKSDLELWKVKSFHFQRNFSVCPKYFNEEMSAVMYKKII